MIDPVTEERLHEGADALLNLLTEYETDEMGAIMCLALASFVRGMHDHAQENGGGARTIERDITAIMTIAEEAIDMLKAVDEEGSTPAYRQ